MTIPLDVEGLRMRYGSTDVLRDVTFQARVGEVVAVLGPNGAGKTTTIEILEGFRMRSGGRVEVLGTDPAKAGEDWRSRVGVVLQSWRDHGKWRVHELLSQLASYYPRPWQVDELMAAVGLTAQARAKVRTLSGGQRRRLDVAIGIVGRPAVLFLDEPTAGFDPQARHDFHDLVRGLAREGGTTILLTTHDLEEAERLADRILILHNGQILAAGTATELAERIAGSDEVRWTRAGPRFVESTVDSTGLALALFREYGEAIRELEIRRASLEHTYLAMVQQAEGAAR